MSAVNKDERVLLVIANLTDAGDARFQWLYKWLDENAINLAKLLMKPHYRKIDTLTGSNVTSTSFVDRIQGLAQDPQTRALDVFLVVHGAKGKIYFDDGSIASSELKTKLQATDLKDRLRLLYSTACYGATHADDFVEAGFRVASGALGVNANGPYDYPTQLYQWGKNTRYKAVVSAGNNRIGIMTHDALARAFGFDDVNSKKIIAGKKYTHIASEAI